MRPPIFLRFNIKRAAKIAAGALIVAVFGWIPLQTVLQSSSVEAVINSRVVTLRAPIDGEISAPDATLLESGVVPQGRMVLRIVNARATAAASTSCGGSLLGSKASSLRCWQN